MLGLTNWWRQRTLARLRAGIEPALLGQLWPQLPLLAGLDSGASRRLSDLALLFLHDKTIEEAQGVRLDQAMRLTIALQACLPVLNLGLDWYRGWYAVIVYPDEFVPQREWVDENGVVWVAEEPMSGEAWEHGPVILSWADVEAGTLRDGFNVVVHEVAHKLDMSNGAANGHPTLHAGMSDQRWADVFGRAYEDLAWRVDRGEETPIDPYASESPAEFFAVVSEAFFELPHLLDAEYPDVYAELQAFFRQHPRERLAPAGDSDARSDSTAGTRKGQR